MCVYFIVKITISGIGEWFFPPNKKAAAQGRFSLLPLCSSLILSVVSVEFSQISLVASRSQSASSSVR